MNRRTTATPPAKRWRLFLDARNRRDWLLARMRPAVFDKVVVPANGCCEDVVYADADNNAICGYGDCLPVTTRYTFSDDAWRAPRAALFDNGHSLETSAPNIADDGSGTLYFRFPPRTGWGGTL